MNSCQALVQGDGSKRKVQKSTGVPKALLSLINLCNTKLENKGDAVIELNAKDLQSVKSAAYVTVEFAGVKFKTMNVSTGKEYMEFINHSVIQYILRNMPKTKRIVLCEEKYRFTPDTIKFQTREQRRGKTKTISHLKEGKSVISEDTYDKDRIVGTTYGKIQIGNYLAEHISKLKIKHNITVDVDSEYVLEGCECGKSVGCTCEIHTSPIRCQFDPMQQPIVNQVDLIQRKGEAEMAQADWLYEILPKLEENESIVALVTSGDIDSVLIHMFTVSKSWPRTENGLFKFSVHVDLQKPKGRVDIYHITSMLELMEKQFEDHEIGMKIAAVLSISGNDFVPKYFPISYERAVTIFLKCGYKNALFNINDEKQISINCDEYVAFIKHLFCPSNKDFNSLTYDEVKLLTIKGKNTKSEELMSALRNSQLWLPPRISCSQCCRTY